MTSAYDMWYISRTHFWYKTRIWSQNFNISSVSCVIFWFTGKSLVLHCFAYIKGITEGIDINSFQPCTRYTRPLIDCRNIIFSCSILCYAWIDRLYHYLTEITWHRWYIEILTSYPGFVSKMGPGNVPHVICGCHLIPSNFDNFYKTCYNTDSK